MYVRAGRPAFARPGVAREGQGYPCCQHDMMMMIYIYWPIGLVGRVFANGPRKRGLFQG